MADTFCRCPHAHRQSLSTWTSQSLGEKHTIALVAGGSLSDGVQKGTERSFQAEGPAKQPCQGEGKS